MQQQLSFFLTYRKLAQSLLSFFTIHWTKLHTDRLAILKNQKYIEKYSRLH